MRDVSAFLKEQQSQSSAELAEEWQALEELYNKKLWHQLTLRLLKFVRHSCFSSGDGLRNLYENFICDFEHRINPLSFVEIALQIVKQIPEKNDSLQFLEKTKEKVKGSDEAVVLCRTSIAGIKMEQGELLDTKRMIEEVGELLENLVGVTSVHSRFYDLSSRYYQLIGDHAAYYKDALRFLGCIDLQELSVQEQQEKAFTLGLAALLGEGVYNFGELLMHPLLESLKKTDKQWLVDLLYAFNSGNVEQFKTMKVHWGKQPDLATNEAKLMKKIQLLCIMEMTFTRPAKNRQLTFQEIAEKTKLPVNEVELLVMKALSAKLVKGSIDEVDKKIHMTWVQPRVLDLQQDISKLWTDSDENLWTGLVSV
uniref:26S proteasome non-ATPase regulatory subunit 13 n=1 Tax=Eptatretus burgeri TaxID=7764 RepID=A0A8C4QFC5_EPTBU